MDTIDRIIELLNEYGYTQKDLTDYLGIKKSVFSAWKSKKSKSYNKYITQIAEFFDIDVEDIIIYELKESAIKKFGFCWDVKYREQAKGESRATIASENLSDDQMVYHATIIFKALFSRSLEGCKYNLRHVDFNSYCAMLLNQGKNQRYIFGMISDEKYEALYQKMVEIFGKQKGIPDGTMYNPISSKKNEANVANTINNKNTTINGVQANIIGGSSDIDEDTMELVRLIQGLTLVQKSEIIVMINKMINDNKSASDE